MALSKMMQHYLKVKEQNKDSILFYRLGDFYEMFFEDAQLVSKLLGIALTGRACGLEERAPMCGVPFHSAETYITRLLNLGYKVAMCEQLSEPKAGQIVDRDVVRVITPGTIIEENMLDSQNNFIVSVCSSGLDKIGVSWLDVSTGEFNMAQFNGETAWNSLNDFLTGVRPNEIICNKEAFTESITLPCVITELVPKFYQFLEFAFDLSNASKNILNQLKIGSLAVLDSEGKDIGICAAGALLEYVAQTQKRSLTHINHLNIQKDSSFLYLDATAKLNLELTETLFERKRKGSLIWVLDHTLTAMGKRNLANWLERPLRSEKEINQRLDAVEEIIKNNSTRDQLSEILKTFSDVERICGRVSFGSVGPRGCVDVQKSLEKLPKIKTLLGKSSSSLLKECYDNIFDFSELSSLLKSAFKEEVPISTKDGNFIRMGFNEELDSYISAKQEGRQWLAELEMKERELTGIRTLKIKFNNIVGYFFDIPTSQKDKVPFRFERRQSLINSERYTSEDLNKLAGIILGAEEKAFKLEQEIFNTLREEIKKNIEKIQTSSKYIAILDSLISFAQVSMSNKYVRPIIDEKVQHLRIENGRHPVVERLNKNERFVPNNTTLNKDCRTMIITGPNMSGKSTYMRQVALIAIMAHIGCFVPATLAEITICDRIFTRIGASDNLGMGQSTFMVEMVEVANIVQNATDKSLLILDEIGRGTSTYDGLSIAWAVIEYITMQLKSFTLFATHYHEITDLEGQIPGIKNFQVAVKEFNNNIIFLHNIVPGSANRSFGIEVANLAGITQQIVERAKEVLHTHEENAFNTSSLSKNTPVLPEQKNQNTHIIDELKKIEPNILTPLEAISKLSELKGMLKE